MLDEGTPRARALIRLLDEPTSTLSTILVVYTLALCAAAAAGFWFDLDLWVTAAPWIAVVAAVLQLLVLLLVQFLGRVVAVARPEQLALTFVRPVELLMNAKGWQGIQPGRQGHRHHQVGQQAQAGAAHRAAGLRRRSRAGEYLTVNKWANADPIPA